MPSITTLIGSRFEQILLADFPDFKKVDSKESELEPDFDAGKFNVEAKTGYLDYNIAPKSYQIKAFKKSNKPVVYCTGFHDFENAATRLKGKSERKVARTLTKHMEIVEAYFISQEIIEKMFEMESRWNKRHTRFYCGLKRRTFEQVIEDTRFERKGQLILPSAYYGIKREDYDFSKPKIKISNFPYGWIINKRDCDLILPVLERQCSPLTH